MGRGAGGAAGAGIRWIAEDRFEIDGVEYSLAAVSDVFASTPGRFCLRKTREEVARYVDVVERIAPRRIFEAGVYRGGSTALLAQLARPETLIAIDLEPEPPDALMRFIADRDLDDSVFVHAGVDQADRPGLERLLDERLGDLELDLVVDDASHFLAESRAMLETLFPRLRPGGLYVLEDWSWAHAYVELWPRRPALTALVLELAIASVRAPGTIASVEIDRGFAIAHRGEDRLGDTFSLAPLLGERGAAMSDAIAGGQGKRGLLDRLRG